MVRLAGWSVSAVFALIVLVYLALPVFLRYGVPHMLARYGVASSVEGTRVSLASEQVTLVGFHIGREGGPGIRWGELTARVDMAALLKGNIRIIDFQVKDARVDLTQLRASDWQPPLRVAAIPEPGRVKVDIGDVVLRDLKFIGLSEQLGRAVEVRSLSVGSLSHLGAGDEVAFHLEGALGEASLVLAGRARMAEDLPVLEGRYELGALDLDGLGRLVGLDSPGSVRGRVSGSGTFKLAYAQGTGVVRTELAGTAGLSNVEIDMAETRLAKVSAEWNGDALVSWPVAGTPPRVEARGSFSSRGIEAVHEVAGAPLRISLEGLELRGDLRYAEDLTLQGTLSSDAVEARSDAQKDRPFGMRATRLTADFHHRQKGEESQFTASKIGAKHLDVAQGNKNDARSAALFELSLENLRWSAGEYAVDGFAAKSIETTVGPREGKTSTGRMNFIGLSAKNIEGAVGARGKIGGVTADRAAILVDEGAVDVSEARAESVEVDGRGAFIAEAVSAASVRHRRGELETWGSGLRVFRAVLTEMGEFSAEEAAAERVNQIAAGAPPWEANGISAMALSANATRIDAGNVVVDFLAHGKTGGQLLELHQAEASRLSLQIGTALDAGRLNVKRLRYRGGPIAALELDGSEFSAPGFSFGGEVRAKLIESERARFTDSDANVFVFEPVYIGELSGQLAEAIRIDAARADSFSHDRVARARYAGIGLELNIIQISPAGDTLTESGRLNLLDVALPNGAMLRLNDISAIRPKLSSSGLVTAGGGRVRDAEFSLPRERSAGLKGIEIGAVAASSDGGHRITFINADAAGFVDADSDGELSVGAVKIDAVSVSPNGRVRAEQASVEDVSLRAFKRGHAASFTAEKVAFEGPERTPDDRLHLGLVALGRAELVMGLDEKGEFLLPGFPFATIDGESLGSLTLDRLSTRESGRLKFFDGSTTPPFEISFFPFDFGLENFSSSDPERKARFSLEGNADEFSTVKASGSLWMKTRGADLEVSGRATGVELERLNTYAVKHTKRAIRSGRGDATFDIAIKDRRLSGTMRFVFSKVMFEPDAVNETAERRQPSELSLPGAVSMLEDRGGIVRLTVPVSGSLDDPRFDFSDGLIQSLMKTVRSTVNLTFKPLGLLVTATGLITGPTGLEFKPVAFDPGESALTGQGLTYLDALASRLGEHPGVTVGICGRAVSADRISIEQRLDGVASPAQAQASGAASAPPGVDAALAKLAEARAAAVRSYLEKKPQVTPERLLACAAKVESTPGRLPRVDLPLWMERGPKSASSSGPSG